MRHPLRQWREARGWSQRRAARWLGIEQAVWSRYERGVMLPHRAQYRRLVAKTGVSAGALVEAYLAPRR